MHQPVARYDVPTADTLERLAEAPLPLALRAAAGRPAVFEDVFFDTPDAALERRGVVCRLRSCPGERPVLSIVVRDPAGGPAAAERRRLDAEVPDEEPERVFAGGSEPARELRMLVDPGRLAKTFRLETVRRVRRAAAGWLRRAELELRYDAATVRDDGRALSFWEFSARRLTPGEPSAAEVGRRIAETFGLRPIGAGKRERAQVALAQLRREAQAAAIDAVPVVVLVAVRGGRLLCLAADGQLRLPHRPGASGEEAARSLARHHLRADAGEVRHLGSALPPGSRTLLDVWLAPPAGVGAATPDHSAGDHATVWVPLAELFAHVGSPALYDRVVLAALAVLGRSDAGADLAPALAEPPPGDGWRADSLASIVRQSPVVPAGGGLAPPAGPATVESLTAGALTTTSELRTTAEFRGAGPEFIDGDLSLLDFNARVLALAEDARTPLLERLRFLSIFGGNLDEFFMVRVAGLKRIADEVAEEKSADGHSPQEILDAAALRVAALTARQQRSWQACRAELEAHGVRILAWGDLAAAERTALEEYFRDQVLPELSPNVITLTPGHPFPRVPHLTLSLAVLVRDVRSDTSHLSQLDLPRGMGRFVPVPGGRGYVPLEEVVRANLRDIYRDAAIEQAHAFRLTRAGDLEIDPADEEGLLHAVDEATRRRPYNAVVRVEVERAMPDAVRRVLLKELQFEPGVASYELSEADLYAVDGHLDLRDLLELVDLPRADLKFAPFARRAVLAADRPVWEQLRVGDVLAHHPYDDFDGSVLRLLDDAAADPAVTGVCMTLYRTGQHSPVAEALLRAARAGKAVVAVVELSARFDEERNISWARQLEEAGALVTHGVAGLKKHAKVALVERREDGTLRRYSHVSSGNYNVRTARLYTDLSLLTADPAIGADLRTLFDQLTGSAGPPEGPFRRCLVSPCYLLPAMLDLVRREAEHARAGRGGRVRLKLNGLSDGELIRGLYDASRAGVEVDLLVRGLCTLRPGVPGLSERIRVVSTVGRFLEHARIYHFANAGDPEYFIGSADWRPRNLRRRVEVLVPVSDPACRERLAAVLDLELDDPDAWELGPHGAYVRRDPDGEGVSAQEALLAAAAGAAAAR